MAAFRFSSSPAASSRVVCQRCSASLRNCCELPSRASEASALKASSSCLREPLDKDLLGLELLAGGAHLDLGRRHLALEHATRLGEFIDLGFELGPALESGLGAGLGGRGAGTSRATPPAPSRAHHRRPAPPATNARVVVVIVTELTSARL